MVSNQTLTARDHWARAGACALLVALCGCSSWRGQDGRAATVPVAHPPTAEAPAAEQDLTATEAAVDEPATSAPAAEAPSTGGPELLPSAPKSYTVQRGDTLWGLASMYLRDPWLWPEIWYVNPQIENPHLIYPGDVLTLAHGADGRPQVQLERGGAARLEPRLRSSPLEGPIATIPYQAIAAFLSRPTVLEKDEIRKAPHVLALRGGHMVGGAGQEIYVSKLAAADKSRFLVYHIGEKLRDPETGDVLGYQAVYTATATVNDAGAPAKAMLSESARETLEGDRLIAGDRDTPANLNPRAPERNVRGQIISVVDGVALIGQYQVVVINRGQRHGIEPGHVLAVDQAGPVVRDRDAGRLGMHVSGAFAPRVRLPDERAGTLLVFKTFDRMSYGLIVRAENAIHVADRVRNP